MYFKIGKVVVVLLLYKRQNSKLSVYFQHPKVGDKATMLGKPHSNSVAQILSISLVQEIQQEQVINLVINTILFMVIAFFMSSCMGLNFPECFRKGLFYSQLDKIFSSSLCHSALHICEVQFPLSSVSAILFFLQPAAFSLSHISSHSFSQFQA